MYNQQSYFAGGEVSPDMYGRTDFAKYSVSAKTMQNFYPHFFGGTSNRPGLRFVAECKDSTKKVKLLPFQFSVEQAYIIEAGEKYFRYYKDGGQIINATADAWVTATLYAVDSVVLSGSLVYRCILAHTSAATSEPGTGATWSTYWVQSNVVETTTQYTQDYLFNLKTAQSADTLYLCNPNYEPNVLTRSSHYDWNLSQFNYSDGPFRVQNITSTTITPSAITGNITLTASSSIFNNNMIGSLMQISHDVTGQAISATYTASSVSASVKCRGDWSLVTTNTWAGTLVLERSKDNGVTWSSWRTYKSSSDTNIEDSGDTDDDLVLFRLNYAYTSGTLTVNFNAYSFIADGTVKITGVTSGTVASATVLTELAYTTATADWAKGAWSTEYGYPSCVKFYQNRLGFAGTTQDPLTLWLSQVGDYPNFLVNTPTQDDDAITAPLVSQGVNSIRSMVSLGNLLGFTAAGEWKIGTGSESSALTPTTIRAVQQGYRGSSWLEPLIVGDRVLFCQEMGSIVRDFGYSLTDDAYKGDDLTVLSRHLFKNHSIVDWAFQQEPDGIIWAVREDGVLLSFTYLKEQDIWAWAEHVTDGKFESVAAIPGDGYTEVWFVVNRTINGTTKRYIEAMVNRLESQNIQDQFFVDSGLTLDNPITITAATSANPVVVTAAGHGLIAGDIVDITGVTGMTKLNGNRYKVGTVVSDTFQLLNIDDDTTIDGTLFTAYISGGNVRKCVLSVSGLSHLEGKTVSILANGGVNTQQVVTSGSVPLDDYASIVHVGLPYECLLQTLNVDTTLQDGTMQSRNKRIVRTTLRMENSYGGWCGYDGCDNLTLIDYALGANYGAPGELFTGDKIVEPYADWTTEGTICVKQSDPLPITVLSIISEVEIGGSRSGINS